MSRKQTPFYETHESDFAAAIGGRLCCSSGRKFYDKGDVKTGGVDDDDGLLADCKSTQQSSYRLTVETWMKLNSEACMTSKAPVLPLRFLGGRGQVLRDLVVCPWWMVAESGGGHDDAKQSFLIKLDAEVPIQFRITRGYSSSTLAVVELGEFVERYNAWQSRNS